MSIYCWDGGVGCGVWGVVAAARRFWYVVDSTQQSFAARRCAKAANFYGKELAMNKLLFAVGVAGGVMAIAALAVMAGIWPLDVQYAPYISTVYFLGGGLNYFALLRSCATLDD